MNKNLIDQLLDGDFDDAPCYGFFDWFCSDKSLPNHSKKMVAKLTKVLKANKTGNRFDPSKVTVIFKNNCPMNGKLYDDFRICDLETGKVIFTVAPFQGYAGEAYGTAIVWDGTKKEYAVKDGTWEDVIKFFAGE